MCRKIPSVNIIIKNIYIFSSHKLIWSKTNNDLIWCDKPKASSNFKFAFDAVEMEYPNCFSSFLIFWGSHKRKGHTNAWIARTSIESTTDRYQFFERKSVYEKTAKNGDWNRSVKKFGISSRSCIQCVESLSTFGYIPKVL